MEMPQFRHVRRAAGVRFVGKYSIAVALLTLSLIATTGCQLPPRKGSVRGTLMIVGGPPPGEHPEPGKITLLSKSYRTVDINVPANGEFSAKIPVANYRVLGAIPKYGYTHNRCFSSPATINVASGAVIKIVVSCFTG